VLDAAQRGVREQRRQRLGIREPQVRALPGDRQAQLVERVDRIRRHLTIQEGL